jgi:hypothetical protein
MIRQRTLWRHSALDVQGASTIGPAGQAFGSDFQKPKTEMRLQNRAPQVQQYASIWARENTVKSLGVGTKKRE